LADGTRLLTLTGPGGTGKTRLALQAVAAAADAFPDGVSSVPLASLRDAGLVLSSVALALGDAGATVVVTSRERLRVSGERVFSVAPLPAKDATELFVVRTAALGLDLGDGEAVSELCSRLDNLPLAVELAAARAGLLSPADMLGRLGGRLEQLSGDRDADPRQQTLRATITWSHDLLERELFARLAVFVDGATLDGDRSLATRKQPPLA
jgi:predicted ATPase